MNLTLAETEQAMATLHRCGIADDDAKTTLAYAANVADSADYSGWLASIKKLSIPEIFRVYGMDSGRAVASLARHA